MKIKYIWVKINLLKWDLIPYQTNEPYQSKYVFLCIEVIIDWEIKNNKN